MLPGGCTCGELRFSHCDDDIPDKDALELRMIIGLCTRIQQVGPESIGIRDFQNVAARRISEGCFGLTCLICGSTFRVAVTGGRGIYHGVGSAGDVTRSARSLCEWMPLQLRPFVSHRPISACECRVCSEADDFESDMFQNNSDGVQPVGSISCLSATMGMNFDTKQLA